MSEPTDLLPLRDAARQVGRSLATLRRWVADGELEPHYGPGTHANNRLVLVSRSALAALAVTSKSSKPGRPPPTHLAELEACRVALAQARAETATVRETVEALRLAIRLSEDRTRDLAVSLDAERARVAGLTAELAALRDRSGLSLWQRLIGVANRSKLPSDDL